MRKQLSYLIILLVLPGIAFGKYSGGTGEPNDPYRIATPNDLDSIGLDPNDWDKHFKMTADINMASFGPYTGALIAPDTGPAGYFQGIKFTGTFDGNQCSIENLRLTSWWPRINHIALFGCVDQEGRISNLRLNKVSVQIRDTCYFAAALVARNYGTITNCSSAGDISIAEYYTADESDNWGGLVAYNSGSIIDCNSSCAVFCGYDCYYIGGLVGSNNGLIERCTSYGAAIGGGSSLMLGGLVGSNNGKILYSYSSASVFADDDSIDLGGLAGRNNGVIYYCYSTGTVSGWRCRENLGGFVGRNYYGKIVGCYSLSRIVNYGSSDPIAMAGFVSENYYSEIYNCFWDTQRSSTTTGCYDNTTGYIENLTGKTSSEMRQMSTFTSEPACWDFVGEPNNGRSDDWAMPDTNFPPILWWQLEPWPDLPAFSGGNGTQATPYLIANPNDLLSIGHNPRLMDKHFSLIADVNLDGYKVFSIGEEALPFEGFFEGNNRHIRNASLIFGKKDNAGFFSSLAQGAAIQNLNLSNLQMSITNGENIGGMVGYSDGEIRRSSCSGSITTSDQSYRIGGLVGNNRGDIIECFSKTSVTAGDSSNELGALIGRNQGLARNVFASATVTCGNSCRYIGGLVGFDIANSDSLKQCYASCFVQTGSSPIAVGGLIGAKAEYPLEPNAGFWDISLGAPNNGLGNALNTEQMQTASTFLDAGWDFIDETANGYEDIWRMCVDTVDYPKLWWQYTRGDFLCPDGVNFQDYSYFAGFWNDSDCGEPNECYKADIDNSDKVDYKDLAILAEHWLSEQE